MWPSYNLQSDSRAEHLPKTWSLVRSGARLEDAASSAASSASDLHKMDAESSSEEEDVKRERQTLKIYLDYVWQHFFMRARARVRARDLPAVLLFYFENEPIDQDVRKTAEVRSRQLILTV